MGEPAPCVTAWVSPLCTQGSGPDAGVASWVSPSARQRWADDDEHKSVGPKHRLDDSEAERDSGCEMPRSVDSVIQELEEQRTWLQEEEQHALIQEFNVRLPTTTEVVAGGCCNNLKSAKRTIVVA